MHAEPNLNGIVTDNPNESKPIGITREMLSKSWFIMCQFLFFPVIVEIVIIVANSSILFKVRVSLLEIDYQRDLK